MKRHLFLTLLACGVSLALCPALRAQDASPAPSGSPAEGEHHGHHGPGDGNMMLQRLTTDLNLTADQQAKIKPILETLHTQVQATRADNTLAPKDKMAKNKDARETANSQINAILTPDQQAKFAAMKEQARNHHHAEGEGQPSGSPAAAATP